MTDEHGLVDFEPTDEQVAALDLDRNVAITAGAGTGKTLTLTARYLKILGTDPDVGPENLVTITFTTDAATELYDRIRSAIDDRLDAAADDASYARWRRAKDGLEDGYVHTIHGLCARLLREFVVRAPVDPDFETLDETQATALMREVATATVSANLDDPDVRRLARLWNRRTLEVALVGLLDGRPESLEWAERWADATAEDYVDFVWAHCHPIDPAKADALLAEPDLRGAIETLRSLRRDPPAVDPDDAGWTTAMAALGALETAGALEPDADTRARQRALAALCDVLTTNAGDRDGRDYVYFGASNRWDDPDERVGFADAMRRLLEALEPERFGGVGDPATDRNSAHYVLALARLFRRTATAYAERKAARNALDYDDLIRATVDLLEDHASVRSDLRDRFDFVMVDEMQDTDPLQWRLVRLLTSSDVDSFDAQNVFVVGDEKQSIYGFRGADVTTFGAARADLEAANPDGRSAHDPLSGSFRATGRVREFLNGLFDRVFEPLDEAHEAYEARPQRLGDERRAGRDVAGSVEYLLVPDADVESLHGPGYLEATPEFIETGEREAYALAARLRNLLADPPDVYDVDAEETRPAVAEDVAVLLRARTRLKAYERALDAFDVPYTVVSGSGFYDTPEITALWNLLAVLENPTDDIALYGLLRSAVFGFTDDRLATLRATDRTSLWAALADADGDLGGVRDLIGEWRRLAGVAELVPEAATPFGRLLSRVIDDTGFLASLGADERPRQAVVNVEKFREQVRAWEEGGLKSLAGLRRRLADRRRIEDHAPEATIPEDADGVQLRTIHSAKGLEFPVVAVPEMGTKFNFQSNVDEYGKLHLGAVETADGEVPLLGMEGPSGADPYDHTETLARRALRARAKRADLAELKRVLYVATTRARDHLLLSGVHAVEAADGTFDFRPTPDDPTDATRWRDWLQPVLFDETTLERLADAGDYTDRIDGAAFTVSAPKAPDETWVAATEDRDRRPTIDVPEAPPTTPVPTITATDYAAALAPDAPASEWNPEREGTGLGSDTVGTIVHRLCELRPDRERWEPAIDRLATAAGETPTETDVESVVAHTERCLAYVEEVEAALEPVSSHDELTVMAQFDAAVLTGDIDRLLVSPEAYAVIDYKTGSLTGRSVDDLAAAYWPQLETYAAALHQADPGLRVDLHLYFSDADARRTRSLSPADLDELARGIDLQPWAH